MYTEKVTKDNYESIVYISHEHQGTSRGEKAEIEYCQQYGIPYRKIVRGNDY